MSILILFTDEGAGPAKKKYPRSQLILIPSLIFVTIAFLGQVAAVGAGLTQVTRLFAIVGEAGNTALGMQRYRGEPGNGAIGYVGNAIWWKNHIAG